MAEELTDVLGLTESRPTRRRASRLSEDMIRDMFNSDTDCSDNDPDFDIGGNLRKARRSFSFGRRARKGSSESSEDVDEPEECRPRKKLANRRKRGTAKTPKHADKRSPALASPLNVPGIQTPGNEATLRAKPVSRANKRAPALTSPLNVPGIPTPGDQATLRARPISRTNKRAPALASPANAPEARAVKGLRDNPKRISRWAPCHNMLSQTPPTINVDGVYTEWNEDTDIIEPARTLDDRSYYCCVEGCVSGTTSDKDGLWLFAMPEKEQLMSAWDERLSIDYERNRPLSPRICFRHFDKSNFVRRQQRLLGLKQDALPVKVEPS